MDLDTGSTFNARRLVFLNVYIYTYICICIYIYIHLYLYTWVFIGFVGPKRI